MIRDGGTLAWKFAASVAATVLIGSAPAWPQHFEGSFRTFDCVIKPALEVKIGSADVGLLKEVSVDRGMRVHEDTVLARLHSRVEAATVDLSRARAGSTAEIDAARARLRLARRKLERVEDLFRREVASREQLDELQAEKDLATAELQKAKLNRELAALELRRAEAVFEQKVIRSPINGVVTERLLSAGEFLHQEAHIMTVAKLDPLYIEAFLPVDLYGRYLEGMVAHVLPEAPVGGEYEAEVTVVDSVIDAASGTFGVRLVLPNPDWALPGGIRCRVAFPIGSDEASLSPREEEPRAEFSERAGGPSLDASGRL